MKPALLNIICCRECKKSNFSLTVTQCEQLEEEGVIDYGKIKDRLEINRKFIEAFDCKNISGEYFSLQKGDLDDDILFNNNIIEGSIQCEECSVKYLIYNGIVDLLN